MTDFWINDRPNDELGFILCEPFQGWVRVPTLQPGASTPVGWYGQRPSAVGATAGSRQLTLGVVHASGYTLGTRRAAVDALLAACQGEVQIRISDAPDRYVKAILTEGSAQAVQLSLVYPELIIPLQFLASDPLYYAVQPEIVALPPQAAVRVPWGGAPTVGLVHIMGITTSTILRTRNRAGAVVGELTLTGTTGASEYVALETEHHRIQRITGSTPTVVDAYSWKGSTDRFPVWGDGDTVELTGATTYGTLFARKAYLT